MKKQWIQALVGACGIAAGYGLSFIVSPAPQPIANVESIPEFAPSDSVLVSEILFRENFNGAALAKAIIDSGARVIIAMAQPMSEEEQLHWRKEQNLDAFSSEQVSLLNIAHDTHWVRDYAPLPVRVRHSSGEPQLGFVDLDYKKEMRLDDTVSYQLGLLFNTDIRHVPLTFAGGNFLTDGKNCYMTNDVRKDLSLETKEFAADRQKAEDYISRYFRDSAGCDKTVFIENAPHEHIDMWAKIVAPHTALVNQITAETVDYFLKKDGFVPKDVIDMRDSLDEMARQLGAYMKVERLPMPAPYRNTMRTYANGILVNKSAILPRYKTFGWNGESYPDQELHARYEEQVRAAYEKHGYKVEFVDADGLIFNGGALHCVAQQIPRVSSL